MTWLVYFLSITFLWWRTGAVYEETFNLMWTYKQLKIVEILWSESWVYWRNGKLRQLSGRFQTLIWRPGDTVQSLESPGLSVDSTVWRQLFPWHPLLLTNFGFFVQFFSFNRVHFFCLCITGYLFEYFENKTK